MKQSFDDHVATIAATQETPTGHVIPVPSRDSVLSFFKKIAKPKKG